MASQRKATRPSFLKNLVASPFFRSQAVEAGATSPTTSDTSASNNGGGSSPTSMTWSGIDPLTSSLSSSGISSDERDTPPTSPFSSNYLSVDSGLHKRRGSSPLAIYDPEQSDENDIIPKDDLAPCVPTTQQTRIELDEPTPRHQPIRKFSGSSHFSNFSGKTAQQNDGSDAEDSDKEDEVARWPRPVPVDRGVGRVRSSSLRSTFAKKRAAGTTTRLSVKPTDSPQKADGRAYTRSLKSPPPTQAYHPIMSPETLSPTSALPSVASSYHNLQDSMIGLGLGLDIPEQGEIQMPPRPRLRPRDAYHRYPKLTVTTKSPSDDLANQFPFPPIADDIDISPILLADISPLELSESFTNFFAQSAVPTPQPMERDISKFVFNPSAGQTQTTDTSGEDRAPRRANTWEGSIATLHPSPTPNVPYRNSIANGDDKPPMAPREGSYRSHFAARFAAQKPELVKPFLPASPVDKFTHPHPPSMRRNSSHTSESTGVVVRSIKEREKMRRTMSYPSSVPPKIDAKWIDCEYNRGPVVLLASPTSESPTRTHFVTPGSADISPLEMNSANPYFLGA